MQRAFTFSQVRSSGGRQEECGVGGAGGGTMAKIITFHVDAKGFYIHSYMSITCINSIWLNRVEGRSSGWWWWGVGGGGGSWPR